MPRKRKRRLTKEELEEIRVLMEKSPPHLKPNIRQIAKMYGVNQPSVVKSLGGWKGIRRGKPEPPKRTELERMLRDKTRPRIPGFTRKVDIDKLDL